MAKSTPAHIIYKTANGDEQTLNFHAVMSEDHKASSQVTKYPVQSGKHISTHAIRENRVITLKGAFSNYGFTSSAVAVGQDIGVLPARPTFGSDTNSAMFEVLESLVQSAQECKVVTNLGIYEPVIFNKFSTQQASGTVDTLNFTISGEEIIKISETSSNAPVPLSFTVLSGPARAAAVFELERQGLFTTPADEISKAEFTVGKDFVISGEDEVGNAVKTTWIYKGRDPVPNGKSNYEVHLSESAVEVYGAEESLLDESCCKDKEDTFADLVSAGVDNTADCFVDEVENLVANETEELYATAIGDLKQSAYGFIYENTPPNAAGAALLKAGIGCIVQSATGTSQTDPVVAIENSLPTIDDMITGAQNQLGFGEEATEAGELLQVKSGCAC